MPKQTDPLHSFMPKQTDPLHSFANLPANIESQLRELLRVRTFSVGEVIFWQGEAPGAMFLVASGRVKVARVTPEGYESILCVRGPGDYFCPVPLLDGGDHLGSAIAMTDASLFSIERETFLDLCSDSPQLLSIVQGDCLGEIRHLLNRLESFAFRNVRERVAITLLDETRRKGDNGYRNELHLTQQELASLVGAARESVSRALKFLEQDQVVKLRRGVIKILDRSRLSRIAEGRRN